MEVRSVQDPQRSFGDAPAAALKALRADLPWQAETDARPERPMGDVIYDFMRETPATDFFDGAEPPGAGSGGN